MSRNTRIVTRVGRFRDMRFHNIVNKVHFDWHAYIELNKGMKTCNYEIITKFRCITVRRDWEFTVLVIVGKVLFTQLEL